METRSAPGTHEGSLLRRAYLRAVAERDGSFDGVFVFGASTTGIYCLPSCPSRRPRADRIVLFPGPVAAETSGFRQCLRCRPKAASQRALLVGRVCEYIQADPAEDLGLAALGRKFSVSPYHLQRIFKEIVGMSPRRYTEECRISRLKARLGEGKSVTDAMRSTGYRSQSWLYSDSTSKLGMRPGVFRRGGSGMRIIYRTGGCPLGRMLVAATEHGICMVTLGEADSELLRSLRAEYPKAVVVESEEAQEMFEAVLGYFEGRGRRLSLDLRGTAFQRKVWAALQTVPEGSVCSYTDVAAMIGQPRAVRAVANACGKNPVPLIIPCHRIVRTDGDLGGYGLGVWRKKALLQEENRRASAAEKYQ